MYTEKEIATFQVLAEEKKELKKIALAIRTAKKCLKDTQRNKSIINEDTSRQKIIWGNLDPFILIPKIFELKFEYRHRHIVYCLLRGRTYEQIENKTIHKPDQDLIKKFTKELTSKIHFKTQLFLLDKTRILDLETENALLCIEPKALNSFSFNIDRSHCSSCYTSSDMEMYVVLSPKSLSQVKKIFRRYVRKHYRNLIENIQHSDFYPGFLKHLKNLDESIYFESYGIGDCPDFEGQGHSKSYDMCKEFNPKIIFSKLEYEHLITMAKTEKEIEEEEKKKKEKEQKKIAAAQEQYDMALKKYHNYVTLKKEFEPEGKEISKIKKPKLPDILKQKKTAFDTFLAKFKKEGGIK